MSRLAEAYFEAESREWRCSACGSDAARATQRVQSPLPPYLVLHLKRFHSDASTGVTRKLRTPICMDQTISLAPYVETPNEAAAEAEAQAKAQAKAEEKAGATAEGGDGDCGAAKYKGEGNDDVVSDKGGGRYRLRALVSHHGAHCWSGHYTCVARLADTNRWVSYDDRCVSLLDGDPTLQLTAQRGGYLLLYEALDAEEPNAEAPDAERPIAEKPTERLVEVD